MLGKSIRLFCDNFVCFLVDCDGVEAYSPSTSCEFTLYKHFLPFKHQLLVAIVVVSHRKLLEYLLIFNGSPWLIAIHLVNIKYSRLLHTFRALYFGGKAGIYEQPDIPAAAAPALQFLQAEKQ